MKVSYTNQLPDKEQYFQLFSCTGWNNEYQFSQEELFASIQSSWYMISVFAAEKLVGFGGIICDGILHALIVDVIVLPEYRQLGIGKNIIQKLVEHCQSMNIRDIQLFCARGQSGFYKKSGFAERPAEAPGMEFKKVV